MEERIVDIKDMLKKTGVIYGNRPAFRFRTDKPGVFKEITHKEVRDMVDCLGTALVSLLNLKGKRVAVIGSNRYEWEVAYLSVVAGTGTVVPLDKALPENELESLIRRSEVEAIFYEAKYEEVLKKLAKDRNNKIKAFNFNGCN
jgi:long-chain acyl-CoA synthetase